MECNEKIIKIIVEQNGERATFEIYQDSALDDFKSLFSSILCFLTFDPSIIAELFYKEDTTET